MSGTLGDYEAIQNVLSQYCLALDSHTADALRECFANDASLVVNGTDVTDGREAIVSRLTSRASAGALHVTVNLWVQELDDTRAQCRANFLLLNGGQCRAHGIYNDSLRKDPDGQWRLTRRAVEYIWRADA